jgi:hypothetical protein
MKWIKSILFGSHIGAVGWEYCVKVEHHTA